MSAERFHRAHRGRYGAPRIQRELLARGKAHSRKRIARLLQVWVSDLTYVPTAEGWLYAAVVPDRWSRRVAEATGGYATRAEAKADFFDYVETYYNRVRRHSALGCQSPVDFENLLQLTQ